MYVIDLRDTNVIGLCDMFVIDVSNIYISLLSWFPQETPPTIPWTLCQKSVRDWITRTFNQYTTQFECVPQDDKQSECLDLVEFGGVAFTVEHVLVGDRETLPWRQVPDNSLRSLENERQEVN